MTVSALAEWSYLQSFLSPLQGMLSRTDTTDIYINRPGEVWTETLGGEIERHDVPALDSATLERLARQIAAVSHQGISREHPLLSASLPDGARVQVVAPPATRSDLAIAIRKHVTADLSLDDYAEAGAFDRVLASDARDPTSDPLVREPLEDNDTAGLLRRAVQSRENIIVSGGTSSGKTTFLNALIREVPHSERLIFIEDTPELQIPHGNAVGLLAVRGTQGEAQVTADDLVSASLRMRPDRILLGELRGSEAYAFLRAINTGHPGSMTTIHADSPEGAIEQLVLLVLQTGTRLSRQDVRDYVQATIGVFVQLSRVQGRRIVSAVQRRTPSRAATAQRVAASEGP